MRRAQHPDPATVRPAPETYRRAVTLLDRHGDDAEMEAARFGDAALERGGVLASTAWGRVGRALDDIRRIAPAVGDGRA